MQSLKKIKTQKTIKTNKNKFNNFLAIKKALNPISVFFFI